MSQRLIEGMVFLAFMIIWLAWWMPQQLIDKDISNNLAPDWYRIEIYQDNGTRDTILRLNGEPWPRLTSMRFYFYIDSQKVVKY